MADLNYRKGFTEGVKAILDEIPALLDRGLPLVDALAILWGWFEDLRRWATDLEASDTPPELSRR